MFPSHSDKKALAMISWHNTLHLFLIPFFWVEKSLGEEGLLEKLGKGKKLKVIFSSVETASGQLVPVPGGCQGSLASSWRHVLAFLAWCCYLHIVIEFTIISFTGTSGVGVSKTREKLRVPFELKVLGIIHRVSILHCEVEVFPVFYLSGVNFGMSFLVESQIQMGRHPLHHPI